MLRRRISEASIFELVKQKFNRDQWKKQSSEAGLPTWKLSIDIAETGEDWSDDGEYHIQQYNDRTLCSFKVYNPDLNKKIRPSQNQLKNLLRYLTQLS